MKTRFYVIAFIVLTLLITLVIPDGAVSHWVSVSGDGEDAIERYELILLLLRIGMAVIGAGVILWVIKRLSNDFVSTKKNY